MCRGDFITFDEFPEFPARHEVGNAAVFLNAAHDDFGDEFAIATDEQFTILQQSLIFANVQDCLLYTSRCV